MKVSIVINNFNYARYLRACIESARSQTWEEVEIIVVDDGSRDASREIAGSYAPQVRLIAKPNGGQGSCYNVGYAACTGDIVCFLDADDTLHPTACAVVARLDWAGLAKAQVCLQLVDSAGGPAGTVIPFGRKVGRVRPTFCEFGTYISPPGSGNFYSREFLDAVMPMPAARWRTAADAYLIYHAPGWGRVAMVPTPPLGNYRMHGSNASALSQAAGLRNGLRHYVLHEMWIERRRLRVVRGVLRDRFHQDKPPHDSPSLIKHKSIVLLLNRHRLRRWRASVALLLSATRVVFRWRHYPLRKLGLFYLWVIYTALAPQRAALRLAGRTIYGYTRGF